MKTIVRTTVLALLVGVVGCTAPGSPTAQQLLDHAKAQATAQNKKIMVLFGAAW
jgi:hypothetical protein